MPSEFEQITTIDDPRVEVFRDVRDRDLRGREDLFMAESELVVRRLLSSSKRIHSILLSPVKYDALRTAIDDAGITAPVYIAPIDLMGEIAGFHVHRGVLAAGMRPDLRDLRIESALGHLRQARFATVLVAEGLTNVDNIGALFRNAASFGVGGMVLDSSCCDPLYRKAIRVSMGHVFSVPYAISDAWPNEIEALKEWGFTIVGAESTDSAAPVWSMPKADRIALVFGSEGHGLSRATLSRCDVVCQIPMSRGVPSVNVAVASAVFLYERLRGRNVES